MNNFHESSEVDSPEEYFFSEKVEHDRKSRVSSLHIRRRIEDAEERRRMRELYDFEDFEF